MALEDDEDGEDSRSSTSVGLTWSADDMISCLSDSVKIDRG